MHELGIMTGVMESVESVARELCISRARLTLAHLG